MKINIYVATRITKTKLSNFLVIIIIGLDKCILIKIVLSLALRNDLWVFPSFKLNNYCCGKFVKLYVAFVVQCKKQCIAHHGGLLQK